MHQPALPGLDTLVNEDEELISRIMNDYALSYSKQLAEHRKIALANAILVEYGSPSYITATEVVRRHAQNCQ